jgi:hypothetical protein
MSRKNVVGTATRLESGRSGIQNPVRERFSATVQTSQEVHPSSFQFQPYRRGEGGQGMTLTIHHLVLKWRKDSALPLISLWDFMACSLTYGLSTNFCVNFSSLVCVTLSAYRFSFNYRRNEQESLQLKNIFQFSLSSFKYYVWLTYSVFRSAFANVINIPL